MNALRTQAKQAETPEAARNPPAARQAATIPGNMALQEQLRTGALRAQLQVGRPDDPAEAEADGMAAGAMSPCACGGSCSACKGAKLRRKADGGGTPPASAAAFAGSTGHPLPLGLRSYFEPRFGADLSVVRVHDDAQAAATAQQISARAYTAGQNIGFAAGQFAPQTQQGRQLLAHELAHTLQNNGGIIRRAPPDAPDAPAAHPAADAGRQSYRVQTISVAEFEQMSGAKADTLPERKLVTPDSIGPGLGMGAIMGPAPGLPVPVGSTGFMWQGSHISQFAALPQDNPLLSFLFGPGQLEVGGFRAGLLKHIMGSVPGAARDDLYFGTPGAYENDFMFPYDFFNKRLGPDAVHTPGGEGAIGDAEAFAAAMRAGKPELAGQIYRFSTPRAQGTFDRLMARWKVAGTDPCPPGANNCINLVRDLTEKSIGGQTPVIDRGGTPIDPISGKFLGTDTPAPSANPNELYKGTPMREGEASSMNEYFNQPEEFFAGQGLGKTPMAKGMWARGLTGVIRAGGVVLLVYNVGRTAKRIADAPQSELPVVVSEEGGAWTGGAIGAILGEALGTVFICGASGPGAALCIAAVAMAGGAAGGAVGQDLGHDIGESAKSLNTTNIMDAATLLFASPEAKRQYGELRDVEGSGGRSKSPSLWDLFDLGL